MKVRDSGYPERLGLSLSNPIWNSDCLQREDVICRNYFSHRDHREHREEIFNYFIKQMERADFAKVATTAESDTLTLGTSHFSSL